MSNSQEPRILYVDDYRNGCELISTLLCIEKCSGNFTIADTPSEALRLIAGEKFDLYILENKLPEMTGLELCRLIRKMDKETPILFFAGTIKPADRAKSLATGANEYLVKSKDLDRVAGAVKKLSNKN